MKSVLLGTIARFKLEFPRQCRGIYILTPLYIWTNRTNGVKMWRWEYVLTIQLFLSLKKWIPLHLISLWQRLLLESWRITAKETKSFRHQYIKESVETCPPIMLNNSEISQAATVKYLGLYLDRRLARKKHKYTKRKPLCLQLWENYWI